LKQQIKKQLMVKKINTKFKNFVMRRLGYTLFLGFRIMTQRPARKALNFCSVMYYGKNRIVFTEVYRSLFDPVA